MNKLIFTNDRLFMFLVGPGGSSETRVIIDLNTTYVALFKSQRDVQRLGQFSRQLKQSEFTQDCYQKATPSSYGHFSIDFDPKKTESLRFCSNITLLGPTISYLPFCFARVIALTNEREKRAYNNAPAKQEEKENFRTSFM